jgi:glyoxylase-like metal-dependent hydrolase (beta-lactamase superfamily II)
MQDLSPGIALASAARMRIHHLNCVSTCPLGGALMDGRSFSSLRARLACHCLLVETSRELVLVDTGFGLRDIADPRSRLSKFFLFLLRPELREEYAAVRQIARLGYDPRDVRHIVLTHLDFDHAGGLDDFPHATVHMLAAEERHAVAQATMLDRMRFRPQQWTGTRANWRGYDHAAGERWLGFEGVQRLAGLPPEILLVPLVGHTLGHAGVAVKRRDDWLLQAGDAYFHHAEMDPQRPRCTPGLRFYQWMMEKDRGRRLANQARLRALRARAAEPVEIICGHDPYEFERIARKPAAERRTVSREMPWKKRWQA